MWKNLLRRPGSGALLWCTLLAFALLVLGIFFAKNETEMIPYAVLAFLAYLLGELRAIRAYKDERWDALHGPVKEEVHVGLAGFHPDLKPGEIVNCMGKEFQVMRVEHCLGIAEDEPATRFDAKRGKN